MVLLMQRTWQKNQIKGLVHRQSPMTNLTVEIVLAEIRKIRLVVNPLKRVEELRAKEMQKSRDARERRKKNHASFLLLLLFLPKKYSLILFFSSISIGCAHSVTREGTNLTG